jgi:DNA-binding transcriptional regulator GbsR (MarR family)
VIDQQSSPEPQGPLSPEAADFMERFASDLVEAGMQRMAARVFACLMISEENALTSVELAQRLRVSPAAISGAVRYLARVHMLSRERQPGSRRERYRLHTNTWYEALATRDVILKRWIQTMREGMATTPPESAAWHRLAETAEFMEFMGQELNGMLERWRQHQAKRSVTQRRAP